ncbi:helix-hairpin-helix domain-containing protein [Weissella thailandensis]|uniref:ComEA family DNA-binding protein n=1 Tax=Weissella thailandensis TaxID=89061 RepID=A0ABX9I213_9LACO|nr:helix-hairpin-helix domain-containing protein [Weissella thailandensis]NKY91710.1 ComEA family DNA-binding protein [Weissella thailandensis]RDS58753.1 ComEA family DNA-binding protein [Weissella thailandensis]GEP75421.1 hypothetical protein WTH01_16680 [Weissella thailandensis]
MVQIKALYYRYQHQICFSIILIIVGISLLIWWQVSQSSDGVSSKDFTTVADHQKDAKKIKKTTNNEKSANIVIDVKGAVHRPGVYYFDKQPIVAEVLSRAGGILSSVDSFRINLAATLTNGQVLYIPTGNEQVPDMYPLPGQSPQNVQDNLQDNHPDQSSNDKINLNTSDSVALQKLPGIGEKRAQDIIKQRETMGGFKVVADLQEVNGIGAKTFAKLEPLVTV